MSSSAGALLLVRGDAPGQERHQHVLEGREVADQVERLEDEADLLAAIEVLHGLGHGDQVLAVHQDLAAGSAGRCAPSRYRSVLLPEPLGPTMNANRPRSIRQLMPRRASTQRVPLRYDFQTFTTSIIGWPQCDPIRMASMGTSRAARQAG